MTIEEQVSKGIMAAMKAKDTIRLEVLRNIKKVFIEAKSVAGAPEQIADSESVKIIQKLAKQGRESAEIYKNQGKVLMRNEHAMGNLERIARDVPEIVAGAGTIITLDQAKAAIDHGAQFIIMPGIGRQVVEYCIDRKIPVIPNCITPGEMTMAVEYGLDMVKFFPIYQLGGLATLNEYTGAYPMLHFLVTGMLNETNFLPLLENRKVICGGDWMFTQGQALVNNDYALIARNLRESVYQAQDLRNRLAIRK